VAGLKQPGWADRLLRKVDDLKEIDPATGKVSFKGFGFDEARVLLEDLLELNPCIPKDETGGMVARALFTAAGSGQLTSDALLEEVTRAEQAYLSRRPQRYVLLTQVSVPGSFDLPRCRIGRVTINFPLDVPRRFTRERDKQMEPAGYNLFAAPPTDYRWVRASITDKSAYAAGDGALDALQLLLGLWNLGINMSTGMRWSTGPRQPVNSIALGPIHTLHLPSGTLHGDSWWYEPDYVAPLKMSGLHRKRHRMLEFAVAARDSLRRSPYESRIQEWIRSYSKALDERDWSSSFVRLWRTLEAATNTAPQDRHEVTVRRAAFLFQDSDYHEAVLHHLRQSRNTMVHSSDELSHMESRLFLLKRYVESVLLFHIWESRDFESVSHATQYLDLPTDPKTLKRRISLLERAHRIRR